MKKFLLLAVMALSGLSALAYDAEIDGIYYIFSGNRATVTYKDANYNSYSGTVVIPESVIYNTRTCSVTSIGKNAFSGCCDLSSITIPNSVTTIGSNAFYYCSGLTSITIPNSVISISDRAFNQCSGLTSIKVETGNTKYDSRDECNAIVETATNTMIVGCQNTIIPNSVTSVGSGAFSGCSGLTSITIPNSVTTIGSNAFYYCSGLTSVTIPNSVTSIGWSAFEGCTSLHSVTIPNSMTSIGGYVFQDCSALTSITIPESVNSIGIYAFCGCSGLISVTIPNNVTNIDDKAFFNCFSLTSVTLESNSVVSQNRYLLAPSMQSIFGSQVRELILGNNINAIGSFAFYDFSSLTSITIPESVTSIGNGAFSGCSGLTSIRVETENTKYDSRNDCNAIIETSSNTLVAGCLNTIIPNSVTSISNYAFSGCSGLTSITIPNSVTDIGWSVFENCSSLTSISIPEGVTSISEKTFYNCSSLSSISIPEGVTEVGSSAFWGCKLHNILIKRRTPPPFNAENSFSQNMYNHTSLFIPCGSWDEYVFNSNWYKFINIRETATTEDELSTQQAYTLMDAGTFAYSVYDPVNDYIGTISSVNGINEDNPNHSWQMIEAGGVRYLYNIGAKKYVKRSSNGLELTDTPEPIEVEDGENGIILGAQPTRQWALVSNEHMSVAQNAIDEVTAIVSPLRDTEAEAVYNLAGQMVNNKWSNGKSHRGINIIGGKKVLIK